MDEENLEPDIGSEIPEEPQLISGKERARLYRKQAYERAKAGRKAQQLAMKNSPAALAYKQKQKELRQQAYAQAKAQQRDQRTQDKLKQQAELRAKRAERDAALLAALRPGNQVEQISPEKTDTQENQIQQDAQQPPLRAHLRLLK